MKRCLFSLLFALLSTLSTAAMAAKPIILAVSEGTSGGIDAKTAEAKYHGLTVLLSKALGTDVTFRFVREFAKLEAGMKAHQFDLVMARPSDYPARGLRDYGYRFVATAEPAGHCMLIVTKNSPLKTIRDLHGKTFVLPEQQAYMTRFCRAELRDNGIDLDKESVFYVREQGAIPFALLNGIADVGGVASYSGAIKKWTSDGQRVLHESGAQPYFPVIAGPALSDDQVKRIQATLVTLGGSEAGQEVLHRLSITGFVSTEEARLRSLLKWLGV